MTPTQRQRHLRKYDPDKDDRALWLVVAWTLVVLIVGAPVALVLIVEAGR